jgi:hypothetical protein
MLEFTDIYWMNLQLKENEFTSYELVNYFRKGYGRQLNGAPFYPYTINNWIRRKKVPVAYGGHRIEEVRYMKEFDRRILTLTGLTRDALEELQSFNFIVPEAIPDKTRRPHKHRTRLYYELLGKIRSKSNGKSNSMLPDNWLELGIRQNQLAKTRYRKRVKK